MLGLIALLAVNRPGRLYCFAMDNLNMYKYAMIATMIMNTGDHIAFHSLYWSCDGTIEYVVKTIQMRLQMETAGDEDVFDLLNKMDIIICNIPFFKRCFIHIRFSND